MTGRAATSPVVRTVLVPVPPDGAFLLFTDEVGRWWPLDSHSVFGAEARSVAFHEGRLVETGPTGDVAVWGTVQAWEPPAYLAFSWHPGRSEGPVTEVHVSFAADGAGTRVVLEHHGWEHFADLADQHRAGYDDEGGWTLVLDQYVRGCGRSAAT